MKGNSVMYVNIKYVLMGYTGQVFCPVNGVLHLADQQEGNTV